MGDYSKSPITLLAGAAIASKRLVSLSSGTAIPNVVGATPIGVCDYNVASGDQANIVTLSQDGTFEVTAAGAISIDAKIYAAAAGKAQALPTAGGSYIPIGIAMEAATADGDIIEFLPIMDGEAVEVVTELTTAAPAITPGSVNNIDSTAAAVDATLADDTVVGRETMIVMTEASNSSTVTIASHQTSDPEVATFDAVDETLVLKWTGTEYVTIFATATFV